VPASGYGFENDQNSWNLTYNFFVVMDTGTSYSILPAETLREIISYL